MLVPEVTDYIIVESNTVNALAKLVVDKLDMGYRLFGSPYCDSNDYHYQAMIKIKVHDGLMLNCISNPGWIDNVSTDEGIYLKAHE